MTAKEFKGWVDLHCEHTGADELAASVLAANFDLIINRWHATYPELCECTTRMIESGNCPRFPNEHMNAIKSQLDLYRAERLRADQTRYSVADTGDRIKGCDCPKCMPPNGSEKYQRVRAEFEVWLKRNKTLAGFFREVPK